MIAEPAPRRERLSAGDRRRQLIGIGLRLLVTRPIHDLSIDEVAAEAGISRGLLFHYFPTKRDYYIAVVRAAGQRLLDHARVPEEGTPAQRVRGIIVGFVGFVQRRRSNYVALVRAGAGGDDLVLEVFENIRRTLAGRVTEALGERRPPRWSGSRCADGWRWPRRWPSRPLRISSPPRTWSASSWTASTGCSTRWASADSRECPPVLPAAPAGIDQASWAGEPVEAAHPGRGPVTLAVFRETESGGG